MANNNCGEELIERNITVVKNGLPPLHTINTINTKQHSYLSINRDSLRQRRKRVLLEIYWM